MGDLLLSGSRGLLSIQEVTWHTFLQVLEAIASLYGFLFTYEVRTYKLILLSFLFAKI